MGLVWKGAAGHKNDVNRSLPSLQTLLAPLWSVPGVQFVSLQKGRGEERGAQTRRRVSPLSNSGSRFETFEDAAGAIASLDLVICVDTATAHLAGALGKPVWVMLPAYGTDWRWMHDREDSPWYPGVMRLIRQQNAGQWGPVIERIARDLEITSGRQIPQAQAASALSSEIVSAVDGMREPQSPCMQEHALEPLLGDRLVEFEVAILVVSYDRMTLRTRGGHGSGACGRS